MPRNLVVASEEDTDGRLRQWMAVLPEKIAHLTREWALDVGRPFEPGGRTSWVAPVRTEVGIELVLKLTWPHPEAEHEADGLRMWDGQGAVRWAGGKRFDDTWALLIERCVPGTTLAGEPESEQDRVICALLRRLRRRPAAGHHFLPLAEMCQRWADQFEARAGRADGLDPGIVREGMALLRSLPEPAETDVVLCTDLHAENVLASEREQWLMIDPKPYVGDPTYDPLQHLLNSEGRLAADPVGLARIMAAELGLDLDRLLLWLFARCVEASARQPVLAEVARRIAPA
jgi:streptomycin 6-kinase